MQTVLELEAPLNEFTEDPSYFSLESSHAANTFDSTKIVKQQNYS